MLAAISIVALTGFLMRPAPPPARDVVGEELVLASKPMVPTETRGYDPVPMYTTRGGYGPAPPDYVTAPTMRANLGYGRNTSKLNMHVEPPKGYKPQTEFMTMTCAPVKFDSLVTKIPGPEPWSSKPVQKVADMMGEAEPDRKFGMQEVYASQGGRDTHMHEATELLSKNWTPVEDQLMIRRQTEQEAQLQNRMVILDPLNRANRAGVEERVPNNEVENNDRGDNPGILKTTVLPERSIPLSYADPVRDAPGWSENGPRWSNMQEFTRVDARRASVIDNAHMAPAEAPLQQPIEIGAYNVLPRVPVNERTHESIVPNASDENKSSGLHSEADLNNHTRTQEPRVFKSLSALNESMDGKLMYGDFMENTRVRDVTECQLRAVRHAAAEIAGLVDQARAGGEGFRVERPVRLGVADFEKAVTAQSEHLAYSALNKNPLYIPNVNQGGVESDGFVYENYQYGA
eukprot:jgi/Mesvir1/23367/Mv21062-RA.1